MKAKVIITVCLLLSIGLLKSDASFGSYEVAVNAPNAPDGDYYDPEEYLADTSTADSEYSEPPEDTKQYEMDIMFGAFKVITKPSGADINLYDSDMYLCKSPSPVYPVIMDESMELREGIPGRTITLMITKEGYKPLKKDIFVPFLYQNQELALENPSVFKFNLKRDYDNSNVSICFYYSYANRHHRYRVHHHWFGAPSYYPWCPPGYIGWYYPPRPPHHHGGGHHGYGYWIPTPPPPSGGGHHSGNNHQPGNPGDGGSGSHGNYPPHHDLPIPPPDGNNGSSGSGANMVSGKPVEKPLQPSSSSVIQAKPNLSTKPDEGTGSGNIGCAVSGANVNKVPGKITISIPKPQKVKDNSSFSETPKPQPKPAGESYQAPSKPKPKPAGESYQAPSKPKPKPAGESYQAPSKPEPKPERDTYQTPAKPKPEKQEKINKPARKQSDDPKPKTKKNETNQTDEETYPQQDAHKKLNKYVKA